MKATFAADPTEDERQSQRTQQQRQTVEAAKVDAAAEVKDEIKPTRRLKMQI
jgi:hypothetical protein